MLLNRNKKYTILVSGASGIVGYGILRSLQERGDCFLIGTTIYPISPADCFSDVVKLLPKTDSPEYLDCLIAIIQEFSVDMIIPAIEADMKFWNLNRQALEKTGTYVLLNNSSLISLCLDKWSFYCELDEAEYSGRIRSSISADEFDFTYPCVVKPRCGFGARGFSIIENEAQLIEYKDKIGSELMIQEYVGHPDEEYTVSAFFDNNSKIRAIIALRRKLSNAGFTEVAESISSDEFLDDIEELADIFCPVGPTDFQFRRNNKNLKLLEINPRISSSTSIRCKLGYNESSMSIDYFLNDANILQPQIKKGKAIRYTEDYIFYDSNNL